MCDTPLIGVFHEGFFSISGYNRSIVNRRRFVQSTVIGLGVGVGNVEALSSRDESGFIDKFGYGVVDFFDSNWDVSDLEEELEAVVDLTCYAYGEIEELADEDQDVPEDPGFLDSFKELVLDELDDNPEAYNWILNFTDDIASLLSHLDVFPDEIGENLEGVSTAGKEVTKFIPLVANVKQILDTGCRIYNKIHAGKSPSESTFINFFKYVALTIIEVILLATGAAVSYRVAFGATGWVNQRLINVVGRRIGWRAYSWVLSQIHWGVRMTFAEGIGQTISDVTETVTQRLVAVSTDANDPLSTSEARQIAKNDVKKMADHTDEWDFSFEYWELNQWREQQISEASQQANQITERINNLLNSLPI